jgi:hypothetical protein
MTEEIFLNQRISAYRYVCRRDQFLTRLFKFFWLDSLCSCENALLTSHGQLNWHA